MKNFFVLLLALILLGCSKSSDEASVINKASETNACNIGDIGYIQVNEGQMHNQLVNLMIDHWSICSTDANDVASEIKRIFNSEGQSIVGGNNMDFDEFRSVVNSMDLTSLISTYQSVSFDFEQHIDSLEFSTVLSSKLKGLVSLMEAMDYTQGVASIQTAICEYYEQNKTGLTQDELAYFGAMADVATFSTKFWLSSNLGGLNKYAEFQNTLNNLCSVSIQTRGFWSRIILADALGVVSSATSSVIATGGASAIPNPLFGGMPTAGVVGLIGGASMSISKAL